MRMLLWPAAPTVAYTSFDNVKEVIKAALHPLKTHANPRNGDRVNREQVKNYFKFTVVRNPWARAFSWYQNVKKDAEHQRLLGVDAAIDFTSFLSRFLGHGYLKPQAHWLKDFKGNIAMDFICRFEQLHQDFDEACRLMGVPRVHLPHTLKGSGKHYADYYDDEAKTLADAAYADEAERFGYRFGDKS